MTTLTISEVDDEIADRLRARAAVHGRTIEAEARTILADALGGATLSPASGNIADAIRAIMKPIGGVDLEPFPDGLAPEAMRFE